MDLRVRKVVRIWVISTVPTPPQSEMNSQQWKLKDGKGVSYHPRVFEEATLHTHWSTEYPLAAMRYRECFLGEKEDETVARVLCLCR